MEVIISQRISQKKWWEAYKSCRRSWGTSCPCSPGTQWDLTCASNRIWTPEWMCVWNGGRNRALAFPMSCWEGINPLQGDAGLLMEAIADSTVHGDRNVVCASVCLVVWWACFWSSLHVENQPVLLGDWASPVWVRESWMWWWLLPGYAFHWDITCWEQSINKLWRIGKGTRTSQSCHSSIQATTVRLSSTKRSALLWPFIGCGSVTHVCVVRYIDM